MRAHTVSASVREARRGPHIPPAAGVTGCGGHLIQVLGIELRSSVREIHTLNHWSTFPAPTACLSSVDSIECWPESEAAKASVYRWWPVNAFDQLGEKKRFSTVFKK